MDELFEFWAGRTAYQIMPDRFYREKKLICEHINGRKLKEWEDRIPDWKPDYDGTYRNKYFYGGNLKGIEEKLPYLKEMGFDIIYLTPIELSESYHHYDVGEHLKIDKWLGDWEDFKSLCTSAKNLDILILVDVVFNHTSTESKYFKDVKYSDWYKKNANGDFVFWWGYKNLPECNTMQHDYQNAMTKVLEKYLENGATGFRFDLGENLPKEFLQALARVKDKYPTAIFVGEMWDIATNKIGVDRKIFDGQFDSIMNYPLSDAIIKWVRWNFDINFSYTFNRVYKEYPKRTQNLLLNSLATHDTPNTMTMLVGDIMNSNVFERIWNIERPWQKDGGFDTFEFRRYESENDQLGDELYSYGKKLLKIALVLLYNIPGIPCVYQGTEICEMGYKDPFNRKPYPWTKTEKEIRCFVKALGKYRKENKDILASGNAEILKIDNEILIMERTSKDARIILAVNRTDRNIKIDIKSYFTNQFNIVFEANNGETECLSSYGILILREN